MPNAGGVARKRTKGEETRQRILDTAQEIVLHKGFSGTSIDEIIDAAEITKGGFFYHFRGKSDLARELMRRYLEQDEAFFTSLIDRAQELVEDPLQQMLLFLKLYAEAMLELPDVHPGCLVAAFTYESQQFDPEVEALAREGSLAWRRLFVHHFERIVAVHPPRLELDLDELGDMLTVVVEGGIILSRVLKDPRILAQQLMQFRTYVRLLFEA